MIYINIFNGLKLIICGSRDSNSFHSTLLETAVRDISFLDTMCTCKSA